MTVKRFRFDIEPMGAVRTTRRQMFKDDAAKRYRDYKEQLKATLRYEYGIKAEPTKAAIRIQNITFHMPISKNAAKNGKRTGDYHTYRPDVDNLVKGIMDVLNGVYWHDDSQVCSIVKVNKVYSDTPGIEIEIVELEG